VDEVSEDLLKQQSAFQSVYNSTEKLKFKGLDSEGIRKVQRNLIQQLQLQHCPENLSFDIIDEQKLISHFDALKQIHFPESALQLAQAEQRLKFEELFYIQLKLLKLISASRICQKEKIHKQAPPIKYA
jgi:ATP-dependent DNA helicase RecG